MVVETKVLEMRLLKTVRKDMFKGYDVNTVNKVYRQARIWNRYYHFILKCCTYEKYTYLNNKFKQYRRDAIKTLGVEWNGKTE